MIMARRISPKHRAKVGRPFHKPTSQTRKLVELAAAVGTPHHDIAKLIGTGTRQLLRDYPEEVALGKIRANVKIGGTLYNAAIRGNITAMIFWQKCQAGWSERSRIEVAGHEGGPIATATVAAEVTDEESMRAYLAMLKPKE
jgi:hypothetical protein